MKFLDQIGGFHGDRDARAIVDRACAQVPRVQVTGNDDHLFGTFAAFDVTDDIIALDIGQLLRRENQFQFHRSLTDQIGDQIRILRRDGSGWNFWRIVRVICLSSMWKPVIGAAH